MTLILLYLVLFLVVIPFIGTFLIFSTMYVSEEAKKKQNKDTDQQE